MKADLMSDGVKYMVSRAMGSEVAGRSVVNAMLAAEKPTLASDVAAMVRQQGDGFVYVASPYSKWAVGRNPPVLGLHDACDEIGRLTGELMKAGLNCYSPIAHSHPIAMRSGIDPLDHVLWMSQCGPMMRAARGCVVMQMRGWQDSVGVTMEIDYFIKAAKPIIYVDPVQLMGGAK